MPITCHHGPFAIVTSRNACKFLDINGRDYFVFLLIFIAHVCTDTSVSILAYLFAELILLFCL